MNNATTTPPVNAVPPTGTAPTTIDPTTATTTIDPTATTTFAATTTGDPLVVVPIEIRPYSSFVTEAGTINVIHEITLGDLLIGTLIMALLSFTAISRIVRR